MWFVQGRSKVIVHPRLGTMLFHTAQSGCNVKRQATKCCSLQSKLGRLPTCFNYNIAFYGRPLKHYSMYGQAMRGSTGVHRVPLVCETVRGGLPMRPTSCTQVMNGERVLRGGLIPEPSKQARQSLRQRRVSMTPPTSANTVLLQALCQQHLPTAQCTSPPCICGQL